MEREVYGRLPKVLPKVTRSARVTERGMVGRIPVIAKQLVGHVDSSAYPMISVDIAMTLVVPAAVKDPVPVLMMFGRSALPAPAQPPAEDLEKINAALRALLMKSDPALQKILEQYPAFSPLSTTAAAPFGFGGAPAAPGTDPAFNTATASGWMGLCVDQPSSIQGDNGAGLTRGIMGLVNKGQPRKPEDWGVLRAWGGVQRAGWITCRQTR